MTGKLRLPRKIILTVVRRNIFRRRSSMDVQTLVPFKVELIPFADLEVNWEKCRQDRNALIHKGDFFPRIAYGSYLNNKYHELEAKMMGPAWQLYRQAFEEVYNELFVARYPGEWIVVGKVGIYYLAAQPKKAAQLIPMDCCRFLGLL